eukprot:maker-scaffold374_size191929-snap-gene-0.33 protein:Tk01254 transcript:maker-scaffold374_size191929-snap-gene-0.33-mRNA-1 annotation:"hypothetical protein DAPPUDRAFT_43071"
MELDEVDALPSSPKYTNLDLLCTLISIGTYIFDLIMDTIVAAYFYHLGVTHGIYHYWYFGLTVTFILLPSLTMTVFSFRWYLMDEEEEGLPKVPTWRWIVRLVVLMLQIAPVLRYLDSMFHGIKSRIASNREKNATDHKAKHQARRDCLKYYTLMVYEDADATLLRLFECFMESAPQLVLQLYILIRDPDAIQLYNEEFVGDEAVDPILKLSILSLSVISSLTSLAWYTYQNKNNLSLSGSICQFFWHFSSITARVLALSFFASIYPQWVGLVCAVHWIIMSTWLICQRTTACTTRYEEVFFALVMGVVYVFSFFNAKEEPTRWKYFIYYGFCFCENTFLIVVWFLYANSNLPPGQEHWYYYPGIFGHYVMFFAAIFFMLLYYGVFHPTGVHFHIKAIFRRHKSTSGSSRPSPILDSPAKDTPAFIDLCEIRSEVNEQRIRPRHSLGSASQSSPALDEMDSGSPAQSGETGGDPRRDLTRSASAPNPENKLYF